MIFSAPSASTSEITISANEPRDTLNEALSALVFFRSFVDNYYFQNVHNNIHSV